MLELQCTGSHIYVCWKDLHWFQFFPTASPPATTPTETTTEDTTEPASTDDPDTGLSATLWGVIGACIAVVFIVFIIILVWCICRTKGKNKGDASKGKQCIFHQ